MRRFEINLAASIKAEKLIYVKWFSERLSRLHDWFIVLLIPVMGVMNLMVHIKEGYSLIFPIIVLFLTLSGTLLLIYSILNGRNLRRIVGNSQKENMRIVKKIALTNDWRFNRINDQSVFIEMPLIGMAWDWGKEMVVIFDEDDVLVNVVSLDKFDTPSPFHWFANKKKLDRFQDDFMLDLP